MINLAQYRCYFLDATGSIGSNETIKCFGEQDAVAAARNMLEHRPHYHGIELWKGARRLHMEVRLPEVPGFVIRAVPSATPAGPAPADELRIARRRMRHLAPRNVAPLPPMHSNSGSLPEPSLSAEARERLRQPALRVLAVQMWHAIARSALQ